MTRWRQIPRVWVILAVFCGIVRSIDYTHDQLQYQSLATQTGAYNFGYDTGLFGAHSFHQQWRGDDGEVRGRYGLTDPNGDLRIIHYTAGKDGYKVTEKVQPGNPVVAGPRPPPGSNEKIVIPGAPGYRGIPDEVYKTDKHVVTSEKYEDLDNYRNALKSYPGSNYLSSKGSHHHHDVHRPAGWVGKRPIAWKVADNPHGWTPQKHAHYYPVMSKYPYKPVYYKNGIPLDYDPFDEAQAWSKTGWAPYWKPSYRHVHKDYYRETPSRWYPSSHSHYRYYRPHYHTSTPHYHTSSGNYYKTPHYHTSANYYKPQPHYHTSSHAHYHTSQPHYHTSSHAHYEKPTHTHYVKPTVHYHKPTHSHSNDYVHIKNHDDYHKHDHHHNNAHIRNAHDHTHYDKNSGHIHHISQKSATFTVCSDHGCTQKDAHGHKLHSDWNAAASEGVATFVKAPADLETARSDKIETQVEGDLQASASEVRAAYDDAPDSATVESEPQAEASVQVSQFAIPADAVLLDEQEFELEPAETTEVRQSKAAEEVSSDVADTESDDANDETSSTSSEAPTTEGPTTAASTAASSSISTKGSTMAAEVVEVTMPTTTAIPIVNNSTATKV